MKKNVFITLPTDFYTDLNPDTTFIGPSGTSDAFIDFENLIQLEKICSYCKSEWKADLRGNCINCGSPSWEYKKQ